MENGKSSCQGRKEKGERKKSEKKEIHYPDTNTPSCAHILGLSVERGHRGGLVSGWRLLLFAFFLSSPFSFLYSHNLFSVSFNKKRILALQANIAQILKEISVGNYKGQ